MPLSNPASILYSQFLETLALEDDSLIGTAQNMALPRLQERLSNPSCPTQPALFTDSEILGLGAHSNGRLSAGTRVTLLKEIWSTLSSIYQVMYNDGTRTIDWLQILAASSSKPPHATAGDPDGSVLQLLPEYIHAMRTEVEGTRENLAVQELRVKELVNIVLEAREALRQETEKGLSSTLPAHAGAQSSQIDLLGATIEASLVKLALRRARAEHSLYNQAINGDATKNMAQALKIALHALRAEEKEKTVTLRSLNKGLREYEAVMELVDCGHEGYQQVVDNWTKVRQDTDECLTDLRRLGWSGD